MGNNKNAEYLNFNFKIIIKPIININEKNGETDSLKTVAKKTKRSLIQRIISEITLSL